MPVAILVEFEENMMERKILLSKEENQKEFLYISCHVVYPAYTVDIVGDTIYERCS